MNADDEIESIGGDENNSDEEEEDVAFNVYEQRFIDDLALVRRNDPDTVVLTADGDSAFVQSITNEEWEEIGRAISNNTHLISLSLSSDTLNDDKMSILFGELTTSTSIVHIYLSDNGLSAAGLRSMELFLHNSNLRVLDLSGNNIGSEGFNFLLRALHVNNNVVETIDCNRCGIESIEINNDCIPIKLLTLHLDDNSINANGCKVLAKLLEGEESA